MKLDQAAGPPGARIRRKPYTLDIADAVRRMPAAMSAVPAVGAVRLVQLLLRGEGFSPPVFDLIDRFGSRFGCLPGVFLLFPSHDVHSSVIGEQWQGSLAGHKCRAQTSLSNRNRVDRMKCGKAFALQSHPHESKCTSITIIATSYATTWHVRRHLTRRDVPSVLHQVGRRRFGKMPLHRSF